MKKYRITKIVDNFNGSHPNSIDNGYTKEGYIPFLPIKGECFFCGTLRTSRVTEELTPEGLFKTLNSTYKLEELENEKI